VHIIKSLHIIIIIIICCCGVCFYADAVVFSFSYTEPPNYIKPRLYTLLSYHFARFFPVNSCRKSPVRGL